MSIDIYTHSKALKHLAVFTISKTLYMPNTYIYRNVYVTIRGLCILCKSVGFWAVKHDMLSQFDAVQESNKWWRTEINAAERACLYHRRLFKHFPSYNIQSLMEWNLWNIQIQLHNSAVLIPVYTLYNRVMPTVLTAWQLQRMAGQDVLWQRPLMAPTGRCSTTPRPPSTHPSMTPVKPPTQPARNSGC